MSARKKDQGTVTVRFDEKTQNAMYLALNANPGVPQSGTFQRSLHELIEGYDGPDIYLDFRSDGRLQGIEILGDI